jgi:hypothetical protein
VRHDPVRDEAERLVSAAIAAVSMAARTIPSTGSHAFATGSDECCVCPICRVIATMRDPSAELSERLSAGAGDLATAVAGMLRNFTRGGGYTEEAADSTTREGDEFWEEMRRKAADAARSAAQGVRGPAEDDPWRQATAAPVRPPMAKKAVAKKAVAKKAPPPPVTAAPDLPAKAAKAVAKKAVAKKAAKKAAPPARPESD